MSLFQPVLYFVFESYGIQLTTSAFSSVMIALIPVAAMISGIFVLREIPSPMQYVFSAISVGGVAIMALSGKVDGTVTVAGIFLLLGAVFSSVAYNVASRKISSEFSVFERTWAMTLIGLIVFGIIALTEHIHTPIGAISAFVFGSYTQAILYLGIGSSVVAFLLLNYANTHLPVAKTTVFSNVTTIVSVAASVVILKETCITPQMILAVVMIIAGVWGVQVLSVRKRPTDNLR